MRSSERTVFIIQLVSLIILLFNSIFREFIGEIGIIIFLLILLITLGIVCGIPRDNMFTNKLKYKLEQKDKKLVKVDRYYPSSKRCSNCGNVLDNLPLFTRIYTCECGNKMDRDINAAINIAIEGFRLITKKNIELTI